MKRAATALILLPIAVYSVLFAPAPVFLAVVALVALLSFREYAEITGIFAPAGYAAGLLILLAPAGGLFPLFVVFTLVAMCLPLISTSLEQAFIRASALVLGVAYIFGAWRTGVMLHQISRHWLMFGLMINWVGDTGAYYIGKNFGRHKLAPRISPGKSWEGAAASLATGVLFGVIYLPLALRGTPWWSAALFAIAANVAGQIGDLAESAIKRSAQVKDSGSLLPGHGGMLDRLDSTMFALPVLYALLSFWP
ncbi:MAG TPA: phosphatidate cytidylyltransferase [Bryobacteraceae bacterium]|nr:phosphatidate cytidylyltransferase [Bryobacteraceae bacterium]